MSFNLLRLAAGTAIISAVTVLAASCNKPEVPADAIVSVGQAHLTLADLSRAMPKGLSEADSAAFADSYISTWISDRLVTEVAVKNLPETSEIDRMTADYRRNLIMWEYVRLKTGQDPTLAVSPDSVRAYHEAHRREFTTSEPMVKGIYLRMPAKAPEANAVKRILRSSQHVDLDKLDKATLHNHEVTYDYFGDRWLPWSQVKGVWPPGTTEVNPESGRRYETEAGEWIHMLQISETLPAGSEMPAEVAAPLILRRLEAKNRAEVERRLRDDLLRSATADGTLRYHDK